VSAGRIKSITGWRWFWPILYAGFIFLLSSLPGKVAHGPIIRYDLALHFFEFALFGSILAWTGVRDFSRVTPAVFLTVVLVGLTYAGLDELHQNFVPGRFMELSDFLADGAGILVGVSILIWLMKWRRGS
jgi:VanZ family protein